MPIHDRVFVVLGAAGSLGPALCRRLAESGARLALVGTRPDALQTLADDLGLPPDRALAHAANLLDPSAVNELAAAVQTTFGHVDGVLHLVGGYKAGATVVDLDPDDIDSMLDQHMRTALYAAKAFVPLMLKNGWGRFIHISTPVAVAPNAKQAPYAIGKAAADTLMLVLAQELKGSGVTANAVQIRSIETAPPEPGKPRAGSTPDEISAAVLWLCGDEADAVNGARVPVFGRG